MQFFSNLYIHPRAHLRSILQVLQKTGNDFQGVKENETTKALKKYDKWGRRRRESEED